MRDGNKLNYTVATIVIWACKWETSSYKKIGNKKTWNTRYRLRHATAVKPHHRISYQDEQLNVASDAEIQFAISRVLRAIPVREAAIVRARFGLFGDKEMNCEQIGKILRISRDRVRQIHDSGVRHLQHYTRASLLFAFVENAEIWDTYDAILKEKIRALKKTQGGRWLLDEINKAPEALKEVE